MNKGDISKLIASLLVCQTAGIIGSFFTAGSIPTWYAALEKPSFNPPNWIFGPVWVTLYLMMGLSFFLVWRKREIDKKFGSKAIAFFGIQLLLNTIWSVIFFGLHSPMAAFMEIVVLWLFILLTTLEFRKISTIAAVLLIPYLLWVAFASVLNFSIWMLN